MQDIITQEILKNSLIPYSKAKIIVETLFEINYELPEEIAARRPSFLNFNNVLKWGGTVENAYVASISALNSKHGCFGDVWDLIDRYSTGRKEAFSFYNWLEAKYPNGIIPGFGNPIYKGFNSDDRCKKIRLVVSDLFPTQYEYYEGMITDIRRITEKDIDANLVFWNAACIYLLGLPKECASLIFILATQIRYVNEFIKPKTPQPEE